MKIVNGLFSIEDLMKGDFKGFSFRKSYPKSKRTFWVLLNPYKPITETGMRSKDLMEAMDNQPFKIKDKNGIILKPIATGGAGFFGRDSFSYQWVKFRIVNAFFKK